MIVRIQIVWGENITCRHHLRWSDQGRPVCTGDGSCDQQGADEESFPDWEQSDVLKERQGGMGERDYGKGLKEFEFYS